MAVKITYFVHGTTTDNEKDISTGQNQGELSELGIEQSKKLKDQIDISQFDVVFCSDLKRAVDSTKLTFEDKIPIKIDARLRECDYGRLNGKPSEIVEPLCEKTDTPFPNGESYEDVKNRISEFLEDLKRNYDGKHIAIVAHKAPQLALDHLLRGKTWEEAFAQDWRQNHAWKPGWEYEVK